MTKRTENLRIFPRVCGSQRVTHFPAFDPPLFDDVWYKNGIVPPPTPTPPFPSGGTLTTEDGFSIQTEDGQDITTENA